MAISLEFPLNPPQNMQQLLQRSQTLAGRTLGDVADALGHRVPQETVRAKGWVGQLLEDALGATASNRPSPDFELLGVELKTVPVDKRGWPKESTYITILPFNRISEIQFKDSPVAHKLSRVLFWPVEAESSLPLSVRKLGTAFLWSPSQEEWDKIGTDWKLFADMITDGRVESIKANLGEVMQVRPKGFGAEDFGWIQTIDGRKMKTKRRGLYLRPKFVGELFLKNYHLPFDFYRKY